jgi:long-subunit fatty acid transport protein
MLTEWTAGRLAVVLTIEVGLAITAGRGVARAQSTAQIPMQFDFLNPGARAMALGGAFVGAADDATTAFANPSGLAFLNTREVSAEGRFRRLESPYLQGGRVSGTVSGNGADIVPGPSYGTDVDVQVSPNFFAFITPAGRTTIAAYLHEVAHSENTFFSSGPFQRASFGTITDDNVRDLPLGGTRTVTIRNYGGAVGIAVTPRLAIGGGLSAYTFDLESNFSRFNVVSNVFSEVDRNRVTATATQTGEDTALGGNVGVLWSLRQGVKLGAQFRKGPSFKFTQVDGVPLNDFHLEREGRYKVPDVFGAGVEWRISESLRVLADYSRVQYSQLKDDFVDFQAISTDRSEQLRIEDGNEVHVGVEYVLLNLRVPLALRGGAWYDPDHAVRYEPTPQNDSVDMLMSATLPGGVNLVHYSFGAGIVLANRFEVNAAADVSSRTTYVTTSAVVRF